MNTKYYRYTINTLLMIVLFNIFNISSLKANIIFKNDFENGSYDGVNRQFQAQTCSQEKGYIDNRLFQIIQEPTKAGNFALKHHIRDCDERSEIVIPNNFLKKDQEYWIGWSSLFPYNFYNPGNSNSTVTIVQQMQYGGASNDQKAGKAIFKCNRPEKQQGFLKTAGPPTSYMTISADGKTYNYSLQFFIGKDRQGRNIFDCQKFKIPAFLDQWENFVMNVKFSSKPDEGFVKLWKNGHLYIDKKVALLPSEANRVGAWKIGGYVGNPGKGERILYTDELRVGDKNSSFNEVSANNKGFFGFPHKRE